MKMKSSVHLVTLLIGVIPTLSYGCSFIESKQPTNGVNKGDWATGPSCCTLGCTHGLRLKSDGATSSKALGDQEGATGLGLFCKELNEEITSSYSKAGNWQGTYICPSNSNIIGIRLNVNPNNRIDNLGVEDVQVLCDDAELTVLDGLGGIVKFNGNYEVRNLPQVEDLAYLLLEKGSEAHMSKNYNFKLSEANWGQWALCDVPTKVCGLETRVDDKDLIGDNVGLSDLIIYCCNI